MKKRLLSLTLIAALCMSLLPVTALAAEEHDSHSNSWTELTADTTTLSGGSYYLSGDVEYSGIESITVSGEVNLCLNGHKLDLNKKYISVGSGASLTLCDCSTGGVLTGGSGDQGGGVYVNEGGTFTLTGGSIAGNTANAGGGVYVNEGGTFTMEDGSINNNQVTSGGGGGVMVNEGTFTLSGGYITGNATSDATYGYGGGVCLYGTFYLSGDSIIQNNTKAGATDNLYLGWNTIKITGPLGENARIGVTAESVPRSFISGWSDNMAGKDPTDYFFSDGDSWSIGLNTAGEAVLGKLCTTITLHPNGGTLPEYSLVERAALPIPTKTGYTFAGWYENQEFSGNPVTDIPTNNTENLNFYAKWTANTYTISADVTPEGAGTVTVNSGTSATAEAGTEVTLSATANSGYRFTGWTSSNGGNFANTNSASTTFTMPANDVTVTAGFEKYYTITAAADSTEGGTVDGGGDYAAGSSVTLNATANEGYRFVGWVEGDQQVSADATYIFPASSNRTLTAKFEKVYNVTVNSAAGGTATADKTTAGVGETVSLTATPNNGYRFTGWTFSDNVIGADVSSKTTSFTMPAGDVNATANFAKIPSVTPSTPPTVSEETTDAIQAADPGETVTVDLSSGSTKLDKEVFETLAGKDVTLVVDLGDDVSWTVKGSDIPADANLSDLDLGVEMDSDGIPVDVVNSITGERGTVQMTLAHDGDFGFTMTLTAPLGVENAGYWANLYHYDEDADQLTFETAAEIDADGSVSLPMSHASQYAIVIDDHSHAAVDVSDLFIDIAPDAWYKDAVQYAYDNGLMTGVSATEFAPEQTTTRAMIVSILARLEGVTTAQAAGFADVDDEWYATAVNWAANVGVVNGYEDNTFKPNTAITREQLAAILMNYAAYKGEDVSNRADLTSYTDQPSTWAEEAMQWAVAEKLITGVTADTLQPQGAATRVQVAAILQRFLSE